MPKASLTSVLLKDFVSGDVLAELTKLAEKSRLTDQALFAKIENEYFGKILVTKNKKLILLTSLPHIPIRKLNDFDLLWNTSCNRCTSTTGKINVPTGCLMPEYFVIGEAPGCANTKSKTIDRTLSYGPAAALVRIAFDKLGIHHKCWYTNIIKCSVEFNRRLEPSEIENCSYWLKRELEILKPKKIIALGNVAYYYASKLGVQTVKVYHPAYFLRNRKSVKDYIKHLEGLL